MSDVKRCKRCGCLFTSVGDVCSSCVRKDSIDMFKLKNFLEGEFNSSTTKQQCINTTGISNKNLSRFLSYDDFIHVKFYGEGAAEVNLLGDRTDGIVQDVFEEENSNDITHTQQKKSNKSEEQA